MSSPAVVKKKAAEEEGEQTEQRMMGRVLLIAGSDSSGGAGLEADQKVLAAHQVYAMTATTALTAQNTRGVKNVHHVPAHFVEEQVEAVVEDVGVDVVKTGMLASAETIAMVAKMVRKYELPVLVVDPVMVSTSGATLLPQAAIKELISDLLPLTTILTPNILEAQAILSNGAGSPPSSARGVSAEEIQSVSDVEAMGRKLRAFGPRWVLVKGGHLPFTKDLQIATRDEDKALVVDVLTGPDDQVVRIESPWQNSTSTHGTGCSLASAIAANLANGLQVPAAVRAGCRYIEAGIRTAPGLGNGSGPLNHFHNVQRLPFSAGYFLEYLFSRPDVKPVWEEFLYHPFVMGMGNGTLPVDSFKGYIIQDYLYLIQFARANALLGYKSSNTRDIKDANRIVGEIMNELSLHINYCKSFGVTEEEIQQTPEHQACTAYTRYVLDVGLSSDLLALRMALAPCLLGYGAVAKMLHAHSDTKREGNTYWPWIENYVGPEFVNAVKLGGDELEKEMLLQSPARVEELVKIFIHATRMEIGFWNMYPS